LGVEPQVIAPERSVRMLTALTGIDRHESIFAALEEAPSKGIG
jgi:hypothetical protein